AHLKEEWLQNYETAAQSGKPVSELAFSSSSHSRTQAEAFLGQPPKNDGVKRIPTMFVIESKNGKRVEFLSYKARESEVLFAPGAQFKVLRVERGDGQTTVYMTEATPHHEDMPQHHQTRVENEGDEDEGED